MEQFLVLVYVLSVEQNHVGESKADSSLSSNWEKNTDNFVKRKRGELPELVTKVLKIVKDQREQYAFEEIKMYEIHFKNWNEYTQFQGMDVRYKGEIIILSVSGMTLFLQNGDNKDIRLVYVVDYNKLNQNGEKKLMDVQLKNWEKEFEEGGGQSKLVVRLLFEDHLEDVSVIFDYV